MTNLVPLRDASRLSGIPYARIYELVARGKIHAVFKRSHGQWPSWLVDADELDKQRLKHEAQLLRAEAHKRKPTKTGPS